MILCKFCNKPIDRIITNCFDREGADYDYFFSVIEPVDGVAEIELPTSWCGYELSENEMMEGIHCPHCGKFPFSDSAGINVETVVKIICFKEASDHD